MKHFLSADAIRLVACAALWSPLVFFVPPAIALDFNVVRVGAVNTGIGGGSVAIAGDTAYTSSSDGLIIVDVSNPYKPVRVGGYELGTYIWDIAVSGGLAFLAVEEDGLIIVDVSDPANVRRVGQLDTIGSQRTARFVDVSGDYAFLGEGRWRGASEGVQGGLFVIDIRNPSNPQRVGSHIYEGFPNGLVLVGDIAYATLGGDLDIINVSSPAMPQRLSIVRGTGEGFHYPAIVFGDYAYIGRNVLDVSDPTSPKLVRIVEDTFLPTYAYGILGNRAYVAAGVLGLVRLDLSDPSHPRREGGIGGYLTTGVAIGGDGYVFAVEEEWDRVGRGAATVVAYRSDVPANPQHIRRLSSEGNMHDVAVDGDYAFSTTADTYSTTAETGLQIIDVSDGFNPRLVGMLETEGQAYGVEYSGGYAYVADGSSGLLVVDVSDRRNPSLVGTYDTDGSAFDVAISGRFAYVADSPGLQVIDVGDPANPQLVESVATGGSCRGVTVSGDYAFVANGGGGLSVIDKTAPTTPQRVAFAFSTGFASDVSVIGNHAYLAVNDGLNVFDVSDPTRPKRIAEYQSVSLGFLPSIDVRPPYAYLGGDAGLEVIDISQPASPRWVGGNNGFPAFGVTTTDDKVFVAGGGTGLVILDRFIPPHIDIALSPVPDRFSLRVEGPREVPQMIQRTTDLLNWEDWKRVTPSGSPVEVSDPNFGSVENRYYRINGN